MCGQPGSSLTFWAFPFILRAFSGIPEFSLLEVLMYAVIENGGKQYRVAVGDKLRLEKIEAEPGSELTLDRVLMLGEGSDARVGTPTLSGALVKATVLTQGRAAKVHIFKMRRRKHYRKQQGHRQYFTEVRITGIEG